jgi:hypothetical protein
LNELLGVWRFRLEEKIVMNRIDTDSNTEIVFTALGLALSIIIFAFLFPIRSSIVLIILIAILALSVVVERKLTARIGTIEDQKDDPKHQNSRKRAARAWFYGSRLAAGFLFGYIFLLLFRVL